MKLDQIKLTDPELYEIHQQFALEEVLNETNAKLDTKSKDLSILSVLIGSQSNDAFELFLNETLNTESLTPIEVREVVYQAVDYLGLGRVYGILKIMNSVFESKNLSLPLENQSTTDKVSRLEKGIDTQVQIFGEGMKDFWRASHVNKWLASNCFGDYYTRKGLNLAERELITFCFLYAQGGCEPQVMGHIFGNLKLGNNLDFLMSVVSQCVPYIGYPRSLNAISAINKAKESLE